VKKTSLQKKKIFYQDNAPANKSVFAMGELGYLYYELLGHPPYSPDLASSDLSLPKTETLPRWSALFFERRDDCSCIEVFCRACEKPLQGWNNGTGASLE